MAFETLHSVVVVVVDAVVSRVCESTDVFSYCRGSLKLTVKGKACLGKVTAASLCVSVTLQF